MLVNVFWAASYTCLSVIFFKFLIISSIGIHMFVYLVFSTGIGKENFWKHHLITTGFCRQLYSNFLNELVFALKMCSHLIEFVNELCRHLSAYSVLYGNFYDLVSSVVFSLRFYLCKLLVKFKSRFSVWWLDAYKVTLIQSFLTFWTCDLMFSLS